MSLYLKELYLKTDLNYVNEDILNLEKRANAIPDDIKNKIKEEFFNTPNEKYPGIDPVDHYSKS